MQQLDRIEHALTDILDRQAEIREAVAYLKAGRVQSAEAMQSLQSSIGRIDERLREVESWKGRIGGLLIAGGGLVGAMVAIISELVIRSL